MKTLLLALSTVPLLAGCFGGFDSRQVAPDTFVLVAAPAAPASAAERPTGSIAGEAVGKPQAAPASTSTVTVRLPRVRGGWSNHELPISLPDGRRDRLAAAAWASPVDEGVGTVMADTLRDRGAFAAVLGDTSPFAGKWMLELEVAEFNARYARLGQAPQV